MSGLDWPGEERRHPPADDAQWAVRAPLAAWLEAQARIGDGVPRPRRRLRPEAVLPLLRRARLRVRRRRRRPEPDAELAAVEELPVEDGAFDLVLCTQVLEHCDDPVRAVRELRRVTAPGGRVLASTHGVQGYHPSPVDYWRWTYEASAAVRGERRAGRGRGGARGGHRGLPGDAARRLHRGRPAALPRSRERPVWLLNRTGPALDGASRSLGEPRPGSLTANFHVVATVAG